MLASTFRFSDLTESNCFKKQRFSDFNFYRKDRLKEEDFSELICERLIFSSFTDPARFKILALDSQKELFFKKLFRLLDLKENWDGENGQPIKQENFQNVYFFADYLYSNYCDFSLMASPARDGSITCDLYDDTSEMLITFNEAFVSIYFNKNNIDTYKKILIDNVNTFKSVFDSMKEIIYEFSR